MLPVRTALGVADEAGVESACIRVRGRQGYLEIPRSLSPGADVMCRGQCD